LGLCTRPFSESSKCSARPWFISKGREKKGEKNVKEKGKGRKMERKRKIGEGKTDRMSQIHIFGYATRPQCDFGARSER